MSVEPDPTRPADQLLLALVQRVTGVILRLEAAADQRAGSVMRGESISGPATVYVLRGAAKELREAVLGVAGNE